VLQVRTANAIMKASAIKLQAFVSAGAYLYMAAIIATSATADKMIKNSRIAR
jgi:hypothetical protein